MFDLSLSFSDILKKDYGENGTESCGNFFTDFTVNFTVISV